MATNPYVSKVIFNNETLIDISGDTVNTNNLLSNATAHDQSGAPIVGSCTYDADTSDGTAMATEILASKTAYVNGTKVVGSMPNRGGVTGTISTVAGTYTIQNGFHDGSGTVGIDSAEQQKIIAGNIKKDISILGVTGTYEGAATPTSTAKTVTPYTTAKTYNPTIDDGVDYYSEITVNAIAYTEVDNPQGGKTVTIGTIAPT